MDNSEILVVRPFTVLASNGINSYPVILVRREDTNIHFGYILNGKLCWVESSQANLTYSAVSTG